MTDFHLDVYCRMCDQLVDEIKKNDALVATHNSRFENTERKLHPDKNLHILALDIIYTSQAYNFYGDMTFNPINAKARKLHFERVAKAKELAETVERAQQTADLLNEARAYIASVCTSGVYLKHRSFGDGVVKECSGTIVAVFFPKINDTKKIGLTFALENGLISFESKETTQKIKEYIPVLKREQDIPKALIKAIEELQPYMEYLN